MGTAFLCELTDTEVAQFILGGITALAVSFRNCSPKTRVATTSLIFMERFYLNALHVVV